MTNIRSTTTRAISPNSPKLQEVAHALSDIEKKNAKLQSAYNRLQEQLKTVNTQIEGLGLADRILGQINQGILFVNIRGVITTYNLAAEKLLNIKRKKVLSQQYWNSFGDDQFGFSMRRALLRLKATGTYQATLHGRVCEIAAKVVKAGSPSQLGIMVFIRSDIDSHGH